MHTRKFKLGNRFNTQFQRIFRVCSNFCCQMGCFRLGTVGSMKSVRMEIHRHKTAHAPYFNHHFTVKTTTVTDTHDAMVKMCVPDFIWFIRIRSVVKYSYRAQRIQSKQAHTTALWQSGFSISYCLCWVRSGAYFKYSNTTQLTNDGIWMSVRAAALICQTHTHASPPPTLNKNNNNNKMRYTITKCVTCCWTMPHKYKRVFIESDISHK